MTVTILFARNLPFFIEKARNFLTDEKKRGMVVPDLNQSGTLKTNDEYDKERKNEYGEKNCVVVHVNCLLHNIIRM